MVPILISPEIWFDLSMHHEMIAEVLGSRIVTWIRIE